MRGGEGAGVTAREAPNSGMWVEFGDGQSVKDR
jgi:hypothetical protein